MTKGVLYQEYARNEEKEKDGVWLNYGSAGGDRGDVRIRVARAGGSNNAFRKLLEAKTRPHRRAVETGTINPDLMNSLMRETLAETVILAWQNVDGPDGKPITFNKKNAIKLLEDLPDLYNEILQYAQDRTLFKEAGEQAEAKNS